jgi:TfoX/Sxy family transcriptional regulator of competence genes
VPDRPTFAKSPPGLVARYRAILAAHPEAPERPMFGYPASFVGGNMATGLYEADWYVRLPDDALAELLAHPGAKQFAPMPGRPMKAYAVLPPSVVADDEAVDTWVARAIAFTASLPPKGPSKEKVRPG